jgi:hypothetical protein
VNLPAGLIASIEQVGATLLTNFATSSKLGKNDSLGQ